MRTYDIPSFVQQLATRTRTPIMVIQTDGSCANSLRFRDISVDEAAQDLLIADGIAFLTFETAAEANARFDMIVRHYPAAGETTLGITVALGLPGRANREFQQIPGNAEGRVFEIAV